METSRTLGPAREALRRDLETLRELPSPSRVLGQIWTVVQDPRASAASLAAVLAGDTALSARTLRLANSAYFGLRQPASDVRAACVVLGFETVKGVAVSAAALDGLAGPAARVLDIDAFWRHSSAVASAAHALARRLGIPDTGTAFCGGMLHDLGRLVLAVARPAATRSLRDQGAPADLRAAETDAYGASHEEVGGWAARRWTFPEALQDAIAGHHGPGEGGDWRRWGAVIHVADVLAHRHGMGWAAGPPIPGEEEAPAPEAAALAALGLSADTLGELEDAFVAALPDIQDLATAARGAA